MLNTILLILFMGILIISLNIITQKTIPETNNRKGLKLYLLRASAGVLPVMVLAMILYLILYS